jgi:RNA recognition motif-containing protein
MITLSVRGLPGSATEQSVENLFAEFGAVHSLTVVRDMFTGKCRGFASVKMEGHEASQAIARLNNREVDGSVIRVERERARPGSAKRRR